MLLGEMDKAGKISLMKVILIVTAPVLQIEVSTAAVGIILIVWLLV